jgi:hypothetical protein
MPSIEQTYINALLADATYANDLRDGDSGADLEGRLSSSMTQPLAKFIGENFEVASHAESSDVYQSGFDAPPGQPHGDGVPAEPGACGDARGGEGAMSCQGGTPNVQH